MPKFNKSCILSCTIGLAIVSSQALAGGPPGGQSDQSAGFKVLHMFAGYPSDGSIPNDVLVWDSDHLFLTTNTGGATGSGTVSWVHQDGSVTILHSFGQGDANDGKLPTGPLTWDISPSHTGNALLGTTSAGGVPDFGTIFGVNFDGSQYARYYDFQGIPAGDGRSPQGGLDQYGVNGDLLGFISTTTLGGDSSNHGTVFQFTGTAGNYSYSVLHRFNYDDGANPYANAFQPDLFLKTVDIYTTGADGGASNLGTVIKIDQSGNSVVLHNFSGSPNDGAYPEGNLISYHGFLFGTTINGGSDGLGTIFKIRPDGTDYAVLYSFKGICCGRSDGSFPHAGLVARKGQFYGTTINGGSASDLGTVFVFNPQILTETVLHAFNGIDGAHPSARLGWDGGKVFYGTTSGGGPHNNGAIFKLTLP
jgi:uncharacterized repeat protein (TIGR03803 family)